MWMSCASECLHWNVTLTGLNWLRDGGTSVERSDSVRTLIIPQKKAFVDGGTGWHRLEHFCFPDGFGQNQSIQTTELYHPIIGVFWGNFSTGWPSLVRGISIEFLIWWNRLPKKKWKRSSQGLSAPFFGLLTNYGSWASPIIEIFWSLRQSVWCRWSFWRFFRCWYRRRLPIF